MGKNVHADPYDVLTNDEESALSVVRQIITNIKQRGMPANIETIEQAMIDAGASNEGYTSAPEFRNYKLRGVHLSLKVHPHSDVGIEISFGPNKQ